MRLIWVKLTVKKLKHNNYVYGIFTGYSATKCFEMHSNLQFGVKTLTLQNNTVIIFFISPAILGWFASGFFVNI